MGRPDRKKILKKLQAARGSKVLCYLTSDRQNAGAPVAKDAIPLFFQHLRRWGACDRLDVFVYTTGGDTLAGFGLARLLREFSKNVGVLVADKCYSAGTLFAMGANQIVMTRLATLSPFDPSITGPLNPVIEINPGQRQSVPLSVESIAGFKGLVTEDWGIKGEEALSAAFRVLAERVHPISLGNVFRSRQQIEQLATKLLKCHRHDDDTIRTIVSTLTKDLGSHDYLISRTEARELLGPQVAADDQKIEDLVWELYQDFAAEMELGVPFEAGLALQAARAVGTPLPVTVVHRLAVVESEAAGDVCERHVQLNEVQVPGAPPGVKVPSYQVVSAGWKHYT